jgi:lysophospholipase L1-like esterase
MKGLVRTLFVSALLLFGAFTASAAADDPPAPLQLGLGDSWAAGFGDTQGEGGYVPDLHEALKEDFNCPAASAPGNAPRWSDQAPAGGCPQLELTNRAIPGATTRSMINIQFPGPTGAIQLLQSRNLNLDPRDDVEVTTLHIGGNDVANPIIFACLFGLAPCGQTIQSELAAYRLDLDEALSALRNAAGRKARIVIGTYDNGFGSCFLAQQFPTEAVPLVDLVLEGGSFVLRGEPLVVPQGLHDIMRDVGEDYGVEVAEVYGDLSPGDWVGGGDCLHPDDSGYDKVTAAFEEALGLS